MRISKLVHWGSLPSEVHDLASATSWLEQLLGGESAKGRFVEMKGLSNEFEPEGGVTAHVFIYDRKRGVELSVMYIHEMRYAEAEVLWDLYNARKSA